MKVKGKNILVLAPKHNTGTKKDATGAFQPEAMAFAKRHRVPKSQVVWIDNHLSKPAMRKAVLAEIEKVKALNGGLQSLAVFCHGWKRGIQFGFNLATVATLAEALADVKDVRVPLYACNTAKGMSGKNSEPVGGEHEPQERLLGQRRGRELLLDTQEGAGQQVLLDEHEVRPSGHPRIHRGVLQREAQTLDQRQPQPGRIRKAFPMSRCHGSINKLSTKPGQGHGSAGSEQYEADLWYTTSSWHGGPQGHESGLPGAYGVYTTSSSHSVDLDY